LHVAVIEFDLVQALAVAFEMFVVDRIAGNGLDQFKLRVPAPGDRDEAGVVGGLSAIDVILDLARLELIDIPRTDAAGLVFRKRCLHVAHDHRHLHRRPILKCPHAGLL
jgi:hypothetical protein